MGDKAYQNAMTKLRAGKLASAAGMRQARMSGFASTTDLIESIMGNAAGGVAGASARLTRQNSRQLQALAALGDRAAAGNARTVNGGRREAADMFGSAVTGLTAPEFGRAAGHSKASQIALAGAARGAVTSARGGGQAMGIMEQGVAAAAAGAQAQTADALLYRAKNDAQLIAQQQSMILQSKLDFQNWKRQQDYLKKLEAADTTGTKQGLATVQGVLTSGAVTMRQYLVDNPDATVDDLVKQVTAGDSSLAGDQAAQAALSALARQVQASVGSGGTTNAGYTRDDEAQDILESILLLYPNYKGDQGALLKTIRSQLDAGWSAAQVEAASVATGGGVAPQPGEDPKTAAGVPTGAEGARGYNYLGQQYDSSTVRWVDANAIPSGWLLVGPARDSQGRVQVARPPS